MLKTKKTQATRILEILQRANGSWISGRYFLEEMQLSQFHARIFELVNNRKKYIYYGEIEASDFKDSYGFKSYRLINKVTEVNQILAEWKVKQPELKQTKLL